MVESQQFQSGEEIPLFPSTLMFEEIRNYLYRCKAKKFLLEEVEGQSRQLELVEAVRDLIASLMDRSESSATGEAYEKVIGILKSLRRVIEAKGSSCRM